MSACSAAGAAGAANWRLGQQCCARARKQATVPCGRQHPGPRQRRPVLARACMRMSDRSAGEPTSAPRPPAVRPQAAFCHSGSGLLSFMRLAISKMLL